MENSAGIALEEITWRSPQHVQMMGGFIHSNNVLFYFAESPFFDTTSNNASLTLQAMHNENLRPFIETREAFEGRLKTMQGLEFIVGHDPLQEAAAAVAAGGQPKEPSNIWVIRKQNRRRRSGMDDEVQILGTFFIVGDFVYMAPSVLSVVGRRMLSAVTSLTKVLPAASRQLIFSPSHGNTYTPPVPKQLDGAQLGGGSRTQSAQASKETTPMPGAQSTTTTKTPFAASAPSLSSSTTQDMRNFTDALSLLSRYGDEYMDDISLVGEPGSFVFSKNKTATGGEQPTSSAALGRHAAQTGTPATKAANPDTPATGPSSFLSVPGSQGRSEKELEKGRATPTGSKDKGKKKLR